jgi:hypothetical protein
MQMPTPGPEHRRLEAFAGRWIGQEHMHPSPWDPAGGPAEGEVRNAMVLDGFALVQDYEQRRGGHATLKGHGVLRWDAESGHYSFHWFDSMGTPPVIFIGNWEGDTLSLRSQGPYGWARAQWTFAGATYAYRMDLSPDDRHWTPFMEGSYARQA